MKPSVEMPVYLQERMQKYIESHDVTNGLKADRFIEIMKTHRGFCDIANIDNEEFMELRNPLIVFLGDSVTGGHFELKDLWKMEIAQDPFAGYAMKFLNLLHDEYSVTTPSLVNSGIAGDNIHGMHKRLKRDVLRYDPDLVVLNASINWSVHRGTLEYFKQEYEAVVKEIITETNADLILVTANAKFSNANDTDFDERTQFIRQTAEKYHLPMADFRKIFDDTLSEDELKLVLSNGENHPTPFAHTIMAEALMQTVKE
ncbi:MAG: hypothetical protein K6A40_08600 [Solobacterium sp.]|nr:hypothetical protein [Solobacterium sp.]